MIGFYLDPITHDLILEDGNFIFTDKESYHIKQALVIRLRMFKGEYFANTLLGVPYLKNSNNPIQLLGKSTKNLLDISIKEVIKETPGVIKLTKYSSTIDNTRKITVNFEAEIDGDTELQNIQIIF